jgi:hypothetical protein
MTRKSAPVYSAAFAALRQTPLLSCFRAFPPKAARSPRWSVGPGPRVSFLFVDGAPEKVEAIRKIIPDAIYTTRERLCAALAKAIEHPPAAPVVPVQMMDRYGTRTTAQKLGVKEGCRVALLAAPRDYSAVLGPMPEGVELCEEPDDVCAVTLWFVEDAAIYRSTLPRMRRLAAQTKLWVIWPKGGQQAGITQQLIRETALAVGLVDYKICSVNGRWSAIAFARKKA